MKKSTKAIVGALLLAALFAGVWLIEKTTGSNSMLVTVLEKGAIYALIAVSMNLLNGFTGLFSLGQAGFMLVGAYTYAIFTIPMAKRMAVYQYYQGGIVQFEVPFLLAIVLADMAAGIFKHSGPLKGLWADFPPRWRPMFTPSLEGLEIAPDTLMRWRFEGHATPGIVHVPEGALGGKFGTVSSHAATVVALLVLSAAEIRRRWFTFLMVAATLLICYSRIYLAKHFPVDLLLGAAVGALTGWAMLCLYRRIKWKC